MKRVGTFEVLDELPTGSMGRAFLVADPARRGRECVARVIDAPSMLSRDFLMLLEAERTEALRFRHPFATRIRAIEVHADAVHIVSEMVDGMPLGSLLARVRAEGQRLPWEVVVAYGIQAAWALQVAHGRPWRPESSEGLVHGRVGPRTLFVTYDGHVQVEGIGFGRARRSLPASRRGLPYLAPELWQTRRLSPASDVFGLGLTLYDALAGRRSFERDDVDQIRAAIAGERLPPLRSLRDDVPPLLDELLGRMVHKLPSERPRTMTAVSMKLRECLPHESAGDPARLAAIMAEHFGDRCRLGVRDRARLRRRLGPHTNSDVATGSGVQVFSAWPGDSQELFAQVPRSRKLSEEPPRTPLFDTLGIGGTDGLQMAASGVAQPGLTPPPRLPPPRPNSSTARAGAHEVSPLQVSAPPLPAVARGTLVGDRYLIQDVLGEGAAAVVYRAQHVLLQKSFALKMLRPELSVMPSVVARFRQEAQAVCQLDHPNIVWVSDFGQTEDGAMYLVMPLLEGRTLFELMRGRPLPPSQVVEIALSALEGLDYAHARGVVHRDLKPDNIMIEEEASGLQVRLLDFGIAKVVEGGGDARITQSGMVPGTPAYMAPEQAAGEAVDPRSDLYALGVVMYEALAGRRPFAADSLVALLTKVIMETPPPLELPATPGVDGARLERAVMRAMDKEKARRFPDARAFAGALRNCCAAP